MEEKSQNYQMDTIKIIMFCTVYILCIMGVLVQSFFSYNDRLVGQQQQQLSNIVRSVSRSIDIYIKNQKSSLEVFASSYGFWHGIDEMNKQQNIDALKHELEQYLQRDQQARKDVLLVDQEGKIIMRCSDAESKLYYKEKMFDYELTESKTAQIPGVYLVEQNHYLLPIVIATEYVSYANKKIYIVVLLDFEDIYRQIDSSSIKADEKSYLIVKNQDGRILMHESRKQIGLHAIKGRIENYPEVDFSSMAKLIEKELEGKEGTYIFDSYWFSDEKEPIKAKKFSAFIPLQVDYGFWIVSINMDYDKFIAPLNRYVFTIIFLFTLILAVITFFVALFWKSNVKQKELMKETEYLKELNSALDELNQEREKMRHLEKLQMVGIMTSGIAHEFNNILAPIMGYSELLLADLPKDTLSYSDAKEIFESVCRARDLVKQIATLSRKDFGKIKYEYFDVNQKIESWIKSICLIKPENVIFNTQICFSSAIVFGSPTQIYEAILNLCTNGFHAMQETGGELLMRVYINKKQDMPKGLEVLTQEEDYIVFEIKDTGSGIDKETLQHIFTPFFTTKEHGQGTGLGLSITQRIINEHRGTIGAISKGGQGSTFLFCIPLQKTMIEDNEEEYTLQDFQKKHHVLIVDDDQKVLEMLSRVLRKTGYHITSFTNPIQALEYCKEDPYRHDILLTDYSMTLMNGIELSSAIRKTNPDMKIIVFSALIKKDVLKAYKQGIIDDYLLKPIKTKELIAKIESI